MFGFGKKKSESSSSGKGADRARRSEDFEQRKAQNKAQLGMFMGLDEGGLELDDTELENELLQLIGDDSGSAIRKQTPNKKKGVVNLDFDMNNVGDDDDDDEEGDLDDPELLAELGNVLGDSSEIPSRSAMTLTEDLGDDDDDETTTHPAKPTMSTSQLTSLLQERLQLYEQAKMAADNSGDSMKARRFTRGIKTLKELQGRVKAGKVIEESEIPPAVSVGIAAGVKKPVQSESKQEQKEDDIWPLPNELSSSKPENTIQNSLFQRSPQLSERLPEPLQPTKIERPPVPPPRRQVDYVEPAPPAEPPVDYNNVLQDLPKVDDASLERLKEYKKAAVVLKRNGEVTEALKYLKLSKVLESALNSGQSVDLDNQFPPVVQISSEQGKQQTEGVREEVEHQNAASGRGPNSEFPAPESTSANAPSEDIFHAPPPPSTVMDALQQRLDKYKSEVEKANAASNSSKARRMGRIVKQYEEAIVLYKKGKPVPFDDLPTPPGFAPIPVGGSDAPSSSGGPAAVNRIQVEPVQPPATSVGEGISPEKRTKPSGGPASSSPGSSGLSASGSSTSSINRGAVGGKPVTKLTLQEKQLREVLLRQKQYRDAAVAAKKRGDINQAREYLRISKGFENLIEASKSGLPVDLKTLPAPPDALLQLEAEDFELVSEEDCVTVSGNLADVFAKLEEDLKSQLKMCMRTRDHFKAIGDIASANRFEGMALDTKRDLDALRLAARTGNPVPKYHYENRVFAITECNTDIKADEIEINVARGIGYKAGSTIDTFLRVELPYPTAEEAQSQKSAVVKDSTDPEYNATYKMSINRSARNFQRFIHRHGVKVEVWSKGGFLRSSTIFGIATIKLQPLENKTMLHDAFDILDGRKIVGKIEVKIRLRDPVLTKEIIQRKEKWLTIDRA